MSAASWCAEAGVKASMFGAGVFVASSAFVPFAPPLASIIVVAAIAVIGALADVVLARVVGVVRERRRSPRGSRRYRKP